MAANYDINYDDKRFAQVESDKDKALGELDKTYDGMISQSDKYFQNQIDASKEWEQKQSQLQQEKTDFTLEKIDQQKDQAKKDYLKEQSGAYTDWQKESNQYGANAEAMAAQGMQNTGFSESSQVSMYNTYQNRVASARESYNQIIMDFNNQMTEARLQNSSALAQIALESQKQRLELALQGFQYKNTLVQTKADRNTQLDSEYYGRYQDVLKQINTENAMAEEVRQYNEKMAEERRQFNESMAFEREQFEYAKKKAASSGGGGSKGGGNGGGGGGGLAINKDGGGSDSTDRRTMNSITALGYGPISEATLAKKVASGEVVQYEKDGVTLFKKATNNTPKSKTSGLKYQGKNKAVTKALSADYSKATTAAAKKKDKKTTGVGFGNAIAALDKYKYGN